MATQNVNHISVNEDIQEQMYDLLKEQFKNKDNIQKLHSVIVNVKKIIQEQGVILAEARLIDTATGIYLDEIGAFLGVPRAAEDDETYRQTLKIRILRTRTHGTKSEIIDAISKATGIPPQDLVLYNGLFKSVDVVIYQSCIDYENGAQEIADMMPIGTNFRLINRAEGNMFGFQSLHEPANSDIRGYGSVFIADDNEVSGRLSSIMSSSNTGVN